MYLRDFIKIGGIPSFSSTEEYLTYDNSVINSIKKGLRDNLIISLVKKNSSLEGKVRIKSKINNKDKILEKILISNKLIGKTLNELGDTRLDDL